MKTIFFVLMSALMSTGAAFANPLCSRFEGRSLSRGFETVGYTQNGVAGYLANPGTETVLSGLGVRFPAQTRFIVYPKIKLGSRSIVMSDKGVFAAVRLSALVCPGGDQTSVEMELTEVKPVLVGRFSRSQSRLAVDCNQTKAFTEERSLSWEFTPANILSVGGEISLKTSVSFSGKTDSNHFYFYDTEEDQALSIKEVRPCDEKGLLTNEPSWQIEIGNSGEFKIDAMALRKHGVDAFDNTRNKPLVSCESQFNKITQALNEMRVPVVFHTQVASIIGTWYEFAKWDNCET